MDARKNFAYSTVLTPPSPPISGLSLVVASGDGAKFPTPPFNLTVWPAGANPQSTNAEIVKVTAIATDTLTIVRAQEGSSGKSIGTGDQVAATITDKTLRDLAGNRVPTDDVIILANESMVIPRKYTIASGKKLVILSGGVLMVR